LRALLAGPTGAILLRRRWECLHLAFACRTNRGSCPMRYTFLSFCCKGRKFFLNFQIFLLFIFILSFPRLVFCYLPHNSFIITYIISHSLTLYIVSNNIIPIAYFHRTIYFTELFYTCLL